MNIEEHLKALQKRTGMYITGERCTSLAAYIQGMDTAMNGGLLIGFREWLIVRINGGNNLHWLHLIIYHVFPKLSVDDVIENDEYNLIINNTLIDMLLAYFIYKNEVGLMVVYLNYQKWLEKQSWYQSKENSGDALRG